MFQLNRRRTEYGTDSTEFRESFLLSTWPVMEEFTVDALGEWESEGGATVQSESGSSPTPAPTTATHALTGTVNQIDWAEQIKERVGKDFDRVATR